jgi:hypothetical protein
LLRGFNDQVFHKGVDSDLLVKDERLATFDRETERVCRMT